MKYATLLIAILFCSCATHRPAPPKYAHKVRARITAFTRFEDRFGAQTAMGIRAQEGITLAAPKGIPLGTAVQIPALKGIVGSGEFIAQDRGSAIRGSHVDVYLEVSSRRESRSRLRQFSQEIAEFADIFF